MGIFLRDEEEKAGNWVRGGRREDCGQCAACFSLALLRHFSSGKPNAIVGFMGEGDDDRLLKYLRPIGCKEGGENIATQFINAFNEGNAPEDPFSQLQQLVEKEMAGDHSKKEDEDHQ